MKLTGEIIIALLGTIMLSIAGFILLLMQEIVASFAAFSLMSSIAVVYLGQMLREDKSERDKEKLLKVSTSILIDELKRNYCVAKIFPKSLLSTVAWDTVVQSGAVTKMEQETYFALLDCYVAIGFYNHDVMKGNIFTHKQDRVIGLIIMAFISLDAVTPTDSSCCEDILILWANPEKLQQKCAELSEANQE